MRPLRLLTTLTMLLLFAISAIAETHEPTRNLMPVPKKVEWTQGKFRLTADFEMAIYGNPDTRIYSYATRVLRRLSGRTGLFFPQDYLSPDSNYTNAAMFIRVDHPGKVELGEDESYQLTVTPDSISLIASTDIGALRGLETFLQLLDSDSEGYFIEGATIQDEPRFPWRGLMIDVCRHWMPPRMIKRNLDGMAAMKMNVFHWHLSEDQGFRIESKTFPKLHEMGSDGKYFTQNQVRDIIQYANDRGIRVVPEFDMPGHSTSWFVGYPELASAPGPYKIERNWGIMDPVMDPTKEHTYKFLDAFLKEMTALFPDPYFHIGGDENNGKQWNANPEIQKFMKEHDIPDNHALQAYFNQRILKMLTKYHKKMVGWDEILHPGMPKNIVIQSWRGTEALKKSAQQGYQGILSNGYYIDLIQPAEYHYLNDPIPADSPLTPEEKENILGGEATSWAELVSPATVDSRIWPRTAAIAERFWSPQDVNDVDDMYRRMEVISFRLEELGLTHRKNYEMMLRRLTNDADISALRIFVDVVEPMKIYTRHRQGVHYTQSSPLTRVVDAARPESMTARHFRIMVDKYLDDKSDPAYNEIKSWLLVWKDNHRNLEPVIKSSPILWEIESESSDLAQISDLGLQALEYLKSGKTAEKTWVIQSQILLDNASQPRGQTELMVVEPVEKLVKAAGGDLPEFDEE